MSDLDLESTLNNLNEDDDFKQIAKEDMESALGSYDQPDEEEEIDYDNEPSQDLRQYFNKKDQ